MTIAYRNRYLGVTIVKPCISIEASELQIDYNGHVQDYNINAEIASSN